MRITKVLKPAYELSIGFQSQNSSIADVIPGIKTLLYVWEHMDGDLHVKNICKNLVMFLRTKFEFELNSPLYKVWVSVYIQIIVLV